MEIPVLVQPVPGKGFVATAPGFGWSGEGPTAAEAVRSLRAEAMKSTTGGCLIGSIDVPRLDALHAGSPTQVDNPWLQIAGMWKDDPSIDQFRKAVEQYRQDVDNDPNR